jgi:hypothetical protein
MWHRCILPGCHQGLSLAYRLLLFQQTLAAFVRGHPSVSLPLLSSLTLPLSICISPTPLHHLQGPHPQSRRLWYSKSNDIPDVDSPKVVGIPYPLLLVPQQHRTSIGYMGAHSRDTMAPSASHELMVLGGLEAWCCIGHYIYIL